MRPIGDHVLVAPIMFPEETDSGIVLPRLIKETETMGTVVALGQGRFTKKGIPLPHVCAEGDVVVFSPRAGHDVAIDGTPYVMLREDELLAVVE